MEKFICGECKKECNNINDGECVVKRNSERKVVCKKCAEKLEDYGWTIVSQKSRHG